MTRSRQVSFLPTGIAGERLSDVEGDGHSAHGAPLRDGITQTRGSRQPLLPSLRDGMAQLRGNSVVPQREGVNQTLPPLREGINQTLPPLRETIRQSPPPLRDRQAPPPLRNKLNQTLGPAARSRENTLNPALSPMRDSTAAARGSVSWDNPIISTREIPVQPPRASVPPPPPPGRATVAPPAPPPPVREGITTQPRAAFMTPEVSAPANPRSRNKLDETLIGRGPTAEEAGAWESLHQAAEGVAVSSAAADAQSTDRGDRTDMMLGREDTKRAAQVHAPQVSPIDLQVSSPAQAMSWETDDTSPNPWRTHAPRAEAPSVQSHLSTDAIHPGPKDHVSSVPPALPASRPVRAFSVAEGVQGSELSAPASWANMPNMPGPSAAARPAHAGSEEPAAFDRVQSQLFEALERAQHAEKRALRAETAQDSLHARLNSQPSRKTLSRVGPSKLGLVLAGVAVCAALSGVGLYFALVSPLRKQLTIQQEQNQQESERHVREISALKSQRESERRGFEAEAQELRSQLQSLRTSGQSQDAKPDDKESGKGARNHGKRSAASSSDADTSSDNSGANGAQTRNARSIASRYRTARAALSSAEPAAPATPATGEPLSHPIASRGAEELL